MISKLLLGSGLFAQVKRLLSLINLSVGISLNNWWNYFFFFTVLSFSKKFFWNEELCDVDIGGLQMCLNHADTEGLNSHLPKPGPTRCFLLESLVTPTILPLSQGK